ncbi:hypothetical protein TNIN_242471 [Trichonephila inaurata madagascariensis]|uniref:Transposase n=1 Tax=Trichonephila inaurata madagascariensis TaxID=2747483 RepID=A0A8X7CJR2_9ARAC|nr:hypothetical protein TNIN_242471 [Trichonephila inaurata madagascariensis]
MGISFTALWMGMPWRPSDCSTGNDLLRNACRTEKLSNACIGVSEKSVHLSVGCTTPKLEEHVLREFEEQPETSMRAVSANTNVSHMTVWRVLGAEGLQPYQA